MLSRMRTFTDDQKRAAWRSTIGFLLIGLIPLSILFFIGFPRDLWTPVGAAEFVRTFLTVALIACAVNALTEGPCTSLEDSEVRDHIRRHIGSAPIINPLSGWLRILGSIGLTVCVVLVIRYVYLNPILGGLGVLAGFGLFVCILLATRYVYKPLLESIINKFINKLIQSLNDHELRGTISVIEGSPTGNKIAAVIGLLFVLLLVPLIVIVIWSLLHEP